MTDSGRLPSLGPLGLGDPRSQVGAGRIAARLFAPEPEVLGARYEIRARLGSGGMGVVDEGFDLELQRPVAIKRLHGCELGDVELPLLKREAQALAALTHPNVVPVFDIVADGDSIAMVMELVEGTSMTAWLAKPPPIRRRLHALRQAAVGLQAAHDRRLVHGDFKPSNVLIDTKGRVRLCDFGLACSAELTRSRKGREQPNDAWGTPRYMSPEQHAGAALTGASDQYAFCVTAWILLTGQVPFVAQPSESLLELKRTGPPPYPTTVDAPLRVMRALRRGLEPDPDDRWPSMSALRRELVPSSRRRWIFAGGLVTALAGFALASSPVATLAPRDESVAEAAQRGRNEKLDLALALFEDGKSTEARARLDEVFEDSGARGQLLDVVESAAWLALITPFGDGAAIEQAARDASLVAGHVDLPERTRSLVTLATIRADRAHEAPGTHADRWARALETVKDPLAAHMGERYLALALHWAGRFDEGFVHLDRAKAHAETLNAENLGIEIEIQRAQLLDASGRRPEARAHLDALLPGVESPARRAHILVNLADLEMKAADFDAAELHFDEAQTLIEALPHGDTLLALRCLSLTSDLQVIKLEFDEALATLERARVLVESSTTDGTRSLMVLHTKSASVLSSTGDNAGAREHIGAALELADSPFEAAHLRVEMASLLADDGRFLEAAPLLEAATPTVLGSDEPEGRFVYETVLAKIREAHGDVAGAREHLRTARRWFETGQGPTHAVAGMLLGEEARLASLLGETVEAQFKDAIEIQVRGNAPPMIYAYTQIAYAQYMWERGREAEARSLFADALPHAKQHPGPPPEYARALAWLEARGIDIDA